MSIQRRQLLLLAATGCLIQTLPLNLRAKETLTSVYGKRKIEDGGLILKTPSLAENGNSVNLEVALATGLPAGVSVDDMRLFAPKNPEPQLAVYRFGPAAGAARIKTRIRLADSQTITAVASLSDGRLLSASSETIITLAACVEPLL